MTTPAGNPRSRLRIHDGNPATLADFKAGIGGDILNVTSLIRDSNPSGGPFIADEPDIAAAELDLEKNTTIIGTATVRVIDANTGDNSGLVAADYFDLVHPPFNTGGYSYFANWTNVGGGGIDFGASGPLLGEDGSTAAMQALNNISPHGGQNLNRRTFTGLTPGQTYHVTCRMQCLYNAPFQTSHVGIVAQPGTGLEVTGEVILDNSGVLPWGTVGVDAVADGSGEIVIDWGWILIQVTGFVIQAFLYIDNLEIRTIASLPAGRIVTRVLADANARMQLLSRRAVLELVDESDCTYDAITMSWTFDQSAPSYRQVLSGYVNRLALVTALVYEIVIGETRREEARIQLGATVNADDGATCLIAGLVRGGFGQWAGGGDLVPDYEADTENRWEVYRVDDTDSYATDGRRIVVMQFVHGWLRPFFASVYTQLLSREADEINLFASRYYADDAKTWFITGQTSQHFGWYPGLAVDAVPVSSGVAFITQPITKPVPIVNLGTILSGGGLHGRVDLMVETNHNGLMYLNWPENDILDVDGNVATAGLGPAPSVGDQYDLAVYPTKVGASNPIHYRGHPVDIHTALLTHYDIPFDATAAANTKTALGDLWIEERETEVMSLGDFVEKRLQGPFGYAPRTGADAERVFFPTRVRPSSPAYDITQADRRNADTRIWEHDEASVLTGVDINTKSWRRWKDGDATPREMDDLVVSDSPVQGTKVDQSTFGDRRIAYDLNGVIYVDVSGTKVPMDLAAFVSQIGGILIDRSGRGAQIVEIDVFPWVTAEIGDEVTVDLPDLPVPIVGNTPVTQRGAAPVTMIVISKKPVAAGFRLRLMVAGTLSQGAPTGNPPGGTPGGTEPLPSITIVESFAILGGIRYAVGFVTVINAATMNFLDLDVEFEYLVQTATPAPTDPGTAFGPLVDPLPGSNDFIDTPPILPGETVWVRARATDNNGHVTSWCTWDGVVTTPTTGGIGAGAPAAPVLTLTVNQTTGDVDARANVDAKTVGVKIAAGPNDGSGDPPSLATIRGTSLLTSAPYLVSAIETLAIAGLVTIGAVAYDVNGNESPMGTRTATRGPIFQKDLADVDVTGLADGDSLVWDAGSMTWIPGPPGAPVGAEYLVGASDATLTAERVVTDTPTVTWDLSTAGQAKANAAIAALDDIGDVTAPSPADGDVLTWDAGAGAWVPTAPGAGGSYTFWDPDLPPGSPSALDDDFDSVSLDAKWFTVNWSATSGFSADYHTTKYSAAHVQWDSASSAFRALTQALPAGDFTCVARLNAAPVDGGLAGILLSDNHNGSSGKQWAGVMYGATKVGVYEYNNWGAFVGNLSPDKGWAPVPTFFRIRRLGTTYYFAFSADGVTWDRRGGISLSGTPTDIGIVGQCTGFFDLDCDWLRYDSSPTATFGGARTI